ncbi:MAG: hypothetical protein KIS67_18565 [Verrucomicrobiae bacterium]|nr:hypothetical protein [Verrucomicrobiae bacterium]
MTNGLQPLLVVTFLNVALMAGMAAQDTAFTYQGRLLENGGPASGWYDLVFTLYPTASDGSPLAESLTKPATVLSEGIFAVRLDFGAGVFTGGERWLEIGVRTNGEGAFITLAPRMEITAMPYALHARNVTAEGLSGTYSNAVNFNHPASEFAGTFSGDGTAVTNVDAARLGGLDADVFRQAATNAAATLISQAQRFINVRDYGALGNGVDQTAALQLAIDQTTNSPTPFGGKATVYLPAGYYVISSPLKLRVHGTHLLGDGIERTRIHMTSNTRDAITADPWVGGWNYGGGTNGLWYCTLEGFQVYKNKAPVTSGTSAGIRFQTGLASQQRLSRAVIRDVKIFGFVWGLYVEHGVGLLCERVEAYGNNYGFWLSKVDSATFINCFAGDGTTSLGANSFGTNYSAAWTIKPSTYAGGFACNIIGGESRNVNTIIDMSSGTLNVMGMNVELVWNGPVFNLKRGTTSASFTGLRVAGRNSGSQHPIFKLANEVGAVTSIGPGDYLDNSTYPKIELNGATDYVNYSGPPLSVTNTATGASYNLTRFTVSAGPNVTIVTNHPNSLTISVGDGLSGAFTNNESRSTVWLGPSNYYAGNVVVGAGSALAAESITGGTASIGKVTTGDLAVSGKWNASGGTNLPPAGLRSTNAPTGIQLYYSINGTNGYFGAVPAGDDELIANSSTTTFQIGGVPGVDGLRFPDGTIQTSAAIAAASPAIYFQNGGGANVTTMNTFLSATVTVTITSPTQRVMVTSHKAFGSTIVGGAANLNLYIGHRPSGSSVSPTNVGQGVLGNRVAAYTRVPMGLSAVITGLSPGDHEVGLTGYSPEASNWNYNDASYTTATVY